MTLTLSNFFRGITHLVSLDIKWGIFHLMGVSGFAQRGDCAQESFCAYNLMLHERIGNRPPPSCTNSNVRAFEEIGSGCSSQGRAYLGWKSVHGSSNPRSEI